jgi:hypothetical protein
MIRVDRGPAPLRSLVLHFSHSVDAVVGKNAQTDQDRDNDAESSDQFRPYFNFVKHVPSPSFLYEDE